MKKYYPMHMHLHSCHQPGASMESHMYNANKLGMKYIHFTDHDTRTGRKQLPVSCFDFSRELLKYEDGKGHYIGWDLVGEPEYSFVDGELLLSSEREAAGITFVSSGKRHTWALLSDVMLTLGFGYEIQEEGRIIIDIKLSQRPPEHKEAHYKYIIGNLSEKRPKYTFEAPLAPRDDGIYCFDLAKDIGAVEEIGGLDNVFSTVSVLVESGARIKLWNFKIDNKYGFNDVIVRQRALADKIGEKYGVKPFVTTEISGAGQHKNCFSSQVPVINYAERNYKVTEEEAVEHILSHGGIFSYNHPFESDKYKRHEFTREELDEIIEYETDRLVKNRVFGATLMEVGFPEGRAQFSLSDHLRLWDNLSERGVFITGDGDSDSHFSNRSWFDLNNFATYIAADETLPFPISEDVFIRSMKEGNVYMGDPVFLSGEVSFECEGRPMGAIVRGDKDYYDISVRLAEVKAGSTVKAVINGEYVFEETVENDCDYIKKYILKPERVIDFSRIELYNSEGRCIMLTNPIYFVSNDYKGYIPTERAGYLNSERQKKDKAVMTKPYIDAIALPEWLGHTDGKTILHIGDTEYYRYPFYKKLIESVKPDIIIHTGDMADEVKVGRMSETREEYIFKINCLAEILKTSGAELIVVPGNNDLTDEIEKILPEAKLLKVNSVVELEGAECRVGHQVMKMTFDKRWSFYGHGFTGETWNYEDNDPDKECRFNACLGAFVVSIKEGEFFKISLPKK